METDDTHPRIRRLQDDLLRAMPPERRFAMLDDLTDATIRWSRDAIRAQIPDATEARVILRWIEVVYGKDLAARVTPLADRLGVAP